MSLDVSQIRKDMIAAARGVFDQKWPEVKEYAEYELKDLARVLGRISSRHAQGKITEERAKSLIRAQIKSMEIVLLAVEGMGILMVEAAINAVIEAVRTTVNRSIGFPLL